MAAYIGLALIAPTCTASPGEVVDAALAHDQAILQVVEQDAREVHEASGRLHPHEAAAIGTRDTS